MTIAVSTKPFRDALAKLQPITGSKTSLPVLGAVTIKTGLEGKIDLSATNLDQWMTVSVGGGNASAFAELSVSSKDLYDTLRFCDFEECVLKVSDQFCTVTAGSSTARLPLITDPLPVLPETDWGQPFVVRELPDLMARCLPFASTDPNRYILSGVFMSEKYGLVSSSRYGLIKITEAITGEANIPAPAASLISKESGDVTVRFSSTLAEFSGDGWTLTTKCIEAADGAKYFNIDPIFAKIEIISRVEVKPGDAIKAAAFAALPLPVELDTIQANHGLDSLRFSSPKNCPNPRERSIPAKADKDHSWAVSARKLATTLRAFGDAPVVELAFTDMQTIMIERDSILAVLMLCRI